MNNERPHGAPPPRTSAEPDDTVLDWARRTGAAELLVDGVSRHLRRRRRKRLILATTAGVALLVAGTLPLSWRENASTAPASTVVASATVLRPERRTLPDGSVVDLNAGAEIEVVFGPALRRVILHQGEAHFQVAHDTRRPFVVAAGAVEVQAVGTAFAVDLGARFVDVLVTEGRVAVNTPASPETPANSAPRPAPPPPLAALDAGKRLVIERVTAASPSAAPQISAISAADMQARLGWRVPRLKFAATPLGEVVRMFNAHAVAGRDGRLVLAPEVPTDLRVSGVLRADDIDSLVVLLAGEFGIFADKRAGETVLRRR